MGENRAPDHDWEYYCVFKWNNRGIGSGQQTTSFRPIIYFFPSPGVPAPRVTWSRGGRLIDETFHVLSNGTVRNEISFSTIDRWIIVILQKRIKYYLHLFLSCFLLTCSYVQFYFIFKKKAYQLRVLSKKPNSDPKEGLINCSKYMHDFLYCSFIYFVRK